MRHKKTAAGTKMPGRAARARALELVAGVLDGGIPLEYLLDREETSGPAAKNGLSAQDMALSRAISATTLRRKGQIDKALFRLMQKPLGARGGSAMHILRIAAAQILFMDVPDHASVSIAMELAKADPKARHFAKLVNGVLRALAREKEASVAALEPCDILPEWLLKSWRDAYGLKTCEAMAAALCHEPYLDICPKEAGASGAAALAQQLGGALLPNGSLRLKARGLVSALPGFEEGAWWVQDMAATLAPQLLGDVRARRVLDLCAAPGGKSAYLAARGARVTAVDISSARLEKLRENFTRLRLEADVVEADIRNWTPDEPFDCVLLDAPCSATGTARRHPDVLWLKSPELAGQMALLQRALLKKAITFLRPGGFLVFSTCSLEPREGEAILDFVHDEKLPLALVPVRAEDVGGLSELVRLDGTVRTRPDNRPLAGVLPADAEMSSFDGLDGFFIAKFQKTADD